MSMRRFVAYIYRCQCVNGIFNKCENMGFCRVEENNDKGVANICLRDSCGVEGNANISVLRFHVYTDNVKKCQTVKLNRCHKVCNGNMNVKVDIGKCEGVLIECCGRSYISLWKEWTGSIEIVDEADKEDNKVNTKITFKENKELDTFGNKERKQRECMFCKIDYNKENNIMESKKEKEFGRSHKEKEENKQDMEQYTRIYNRLCKVRMILNGKEYPVVKLKLYELSMLPRTCWRMANNVFLMEGYYRYGHVLFMEYNGEYVLAVPWQKEAKAEKRARQCGFVECIMGYEYGKEKDKRLYFIKYLNCFS